MNLKQLRLLLTAVLVLPSANLLAAPLVVHEWGTFTSLQNEKGEAIGGINTDDERVPSFVHRLQNFLLLSPTEVPATFFQGAPHCHPDVTMRLETPVLYFHPSPSQTNLQGVNVTAKFHGGWLSEFYPDATISAPGVKTNGGFGVGAFGPLTPGTLGSLAWSNLEVGGNWAGPVTSEHVWTAPRAVQAADVRTPAGEAEKFLFYRGVAHIDAPLAISQDTDSRELTLRSQCPVELANAGLAVKSLWLVDIRADGQVAFRNLPPVTLAGSGKMLAKVPGNFTEGTYSAANRDKLKASLLTALMAEGLFADEAQALLDTWELSYFKSAGLRVFFLVPRAWTDYYLPLEISTPADITRVMVGRIELVTPAERDNLRRIAQLSDEKIAADAVRLRTDFYGRLTGRSGADSANVNAGRETLAAFGVVPPSSYQMYLDLGRFRNALILEAARQHPDSAALAHFIRDYGLRSLINPWRDITP